MNIVGRLFIYCRYRLLKIMFMLLLVSGSVVVLLYRCWNGFY